MQDFYNSLGKVESNGVGKEKSQTFNNAEDLFDWIIKYLQSVNKCKNVAL